MAKKLKKDALDSLLEELENEPLPADQQLGDQQLGDGLRDDQQPVNGLVSEPAVKPSPSPSSSSPVQVVTRSAAQTDDDPSVAIMTMLTKIRDEFETISDRVLGEWEGDRAQIQGVINTFLVAVGTNPNGASRPVVEGLVKLLETKVNSGMMAVKLLEVKTKLLMALRGGGVTINNQNISASGQNAELTDILSGPVESDLDD